MLVGVFMNKLYLFNSDADLALADFTDHYMAPALIRQMSDDLALLPLWYALPGSAVIAASAYNLAFLKQMKSWFDMQVELVTWSELVGDGGWKLLPWGWSPSLKKRFIKKGISEDVLPIHSDLVTLRCLASRERALKVLEGCQNLPQVCGSGVVLFSVEDCRNYWTHHHGCCVFKAPWSGSGKGLLWCYSDFSDSVAGWCRHILTIQGTIIGMPIYNKVCDFAMEFISDGQGSVSFAGYSWFDTNAKGAYQGNWLASDSMIEKRLSGYVKLSNLTVIREQVQKLLVEFYGQYQGYLGVDMLICQQADQSYAVCPCIEVNLRMNMGVVARIFADRYLKHESVGYFKVEAFATSLDLQQAHEADLAAHPLFVDNGKLLEGYLPLVPVTPHSRYRAYVKAVASKK